MPAKATGTCTAAVRGPGTPPVFGPPPAKPAVLDPAPVIVEVPASTWSQRHGPRLTGSGAASGDDDLTHTTRRHATRTRTYPVPRRRRNRGQLRGSPQFRLRAGFVLIAMVLSVFGARLVQLQGVDPGSYAAMAAAEGTVEVVLPAERGDILDRNGEPLADSVDGLMVVADPAQTTDTPPRSRASSRSGSRSTTSTPSPGCASAAAASSTSPAAFPRPSPTT